MLPVMTLPLKEILTTRHAVLDQKEVTSIHLAAWAMTIAPTTFLKIAPPAVIEVCAPFRTFAAVEINMMQTVAHAQSIHALKVSQQT